MTEVRTRFAPSPTGYLHVGGARTAIFNWLYARHAGGKFFLRIEDTDAARSGDDMVRAILEGMQWLGLEWDDDVIYQSQRLEKYRQTAQDLIEAGSAYKCFCSKEDLQQRREAAAVEKRDYRYREDRTCLKLSAKDILAREQAGQPYVVRLRIPDSGETTFVDQVYGEIAVRHSQLDDFVILRPDGYPTYHLAVVVDDHDMGITHIIRGDDHLSNTPKHVLLYEALQRTPPAFAHVPLILGPDKHRLSKRHGATAVGEYEKQGYLNRAMVNFLSLLGWSPGDDREILTTDELIQTFKLSGINKKSAVFDETKLEWMNGQYIMKLETQALVEMVTPWLVEAGLVTVDFLKENQTWVAAIMKLLQPRLKKLSDVVPAAAYFFRAPTEYDDKGIRKYWQKPGASQQLQALSDRFSSVNDFATVQLEPIIRTFAEEKGVGAGKIIHPLRLALTGTTFSPGIFEVMEILGKQNVLHRIESAVGYIEKHRLANKEVA